MRCTEFYELWTKDENWCEKCPAAVSQINSYLKLIDNLEKEGINKDFAFQNLSEGAARPITYEKSPTIKDEALSKVVERLKVAQTRKNEGKPVFKITAPEVARLIGKHKKQNKPKKKEVEVDEEYLRVPLASVIEWLLNNARQYYTDVGFDLKTLILDFKEEMQLRHGAQPKT